jgi:glycosyltransferase involved in cell wall biosynthesis
MSPKVFSFVIPTYRRPDSLREVLDALHVIAIPDGWSLDVVVVENGVKDGAESVTASARAAGMPVRYVFEPRPGRARALNRGISDAGGDTLCTLDDDIVLPPNWLRHVTNALGKYPDGMVFGGPLRPRWHDGRRPPWFRDGIGVEFSLGDHDCEFPHPGNPLNGHRVLRRSVFERYGLYREDRDIIGTQRKSFAGEQYLDQVRKDGGKVYYLARAGGEHLMTPEQATRAYYRRVAWRSGRGDAEITLSDGQIRRSVLGVPLYVLRAAVTDFGAYIVSRLHLNSGQRFRAELSFVKLAGEVCYYVRHWLRLRRSRPYLGWSRESLTGASRPRAE